MTVIHLPRIGLFLMNRNVPLTVAMRHARLLRRSFEEGDNAGRSGNSAGHLTECDILRVLRHLLTVLPVCLLVACEGTITSPVPLLNTANATWPFPATVEIEASTFNGHAWENIEGEARLSLTDGAYRLSNPNETTPTAETFLFRRITDDSFIAQAGNGDEWAYGLIVHSERYYLFAFNRAEQNCTILSAAERKRFGVIIEGGRCLVSNLDDLTDLLLHLWERFPNPTSAFAVH